MVNGWSSERSVPISIPLIILQEKQWDQGFGNRCLINLEEEVSEVDGPLNVRSKDWGFIWCDDFVGRTNRVVLGLVMFILVRGLNLQS